MGLGLTGVCGFIFAAGGSIGGQKHIVQVSGIVIRMMESTNEVEKNIIEAIFLTKPKQGMCND